MEPNTGACVRPTVGILGEPMCWIVTPRTYLDGRLSCISSGWLLWFAVAFRVSRAFVPSHVTCSISQHCLPVR